MDRETRDSQMWKPVIASEGKRKGDSNRRQHNSNSIFSSKRSKTQLYTTIVKFVFRIARTRHASNIEHRNIHSQHIDESRKTDSILKAIRRRYVSLQCVFFHSDSLLYSIYLWPKQSNAGRCEGSADDVVQCCMPKDKLFIRFDTTRPLTLILLHFTNNKSIHCVWIGFFLSFV